VRIVSTNYSAQFVAEAPLRYFQACSLPGEHSPGGAPEIMDRERLEPMLQLRQRGVEGVDTNVRVPGLSGVPAAREYEVGACAESPQSP